MVAGEQPLSVGHETGTAGQFAVSVPSEITPGPYLVAASGTDPAGNDVLSQASIDVERPDDPQSMTIENGYIEMRKQGEQSSLNVRGIYADGARLLLQRSSKITFASANPNIATVSSSGVITAITQGETSVSASTAGGAVQASVPVRVLLAKATAEDATAPTTQATVAPPAN